MQNERHNGAHDSWCKLHKANKWTKMLQYVETYGEKHQLNNEEKQVLTAFLKDCMDKKKLMKTKEVKYDKESGVILDIPALMFTCNNNDVGQRNSDNRSNGIMDETAGTISKQWRNLTKTAKHFTLKSLDTKRVSTLKSLPPSKSTTRDKDKLPNCVS